MPYIGKNPVGGGFHKLDNLTASATDTYALTLNSAAYYPESANQLLVSLNGVIQAPQDSFTVSGSNLVFASALTVSDSIDFVVALGDVLAVQTVTDGAITTAKLGNGAVTDAKIDTMAASKLTGTLDTARFPSGTVVAVRFYSDDTRAAISSAATGTIISFTDTKLYGSETDIIVTANVIGHDQSSGSGATGAYIGYDGTEKYSIDNNYNAQAYNNTMTGQAKFTGVSSGSRTVKVGWNTANGVAATPFPVVNPNSTDDARGQQSESTIIVYEVVA